MTRPSTTTNCNSRKRGIPLPLVLLLLLGVFLVPILAVRPGDGVLIPTLNTTFFLKNETYRFTLTRHFQVPLDIVKHTIYTASMAEIKAVAQRTILEKRAKLLEFSEEDHAFLEEMVFEGALPNFVKVDKKKRSLLPTAEGVRAIPLTNDGHKLIHFQQDEEIMKRTNVPLGSAYCLHIPFFTSCPDDTGTQEVKDAIQGAVNAMRTEIDSYKQTNNQRDTALAQVLNQQRQYIDNLIQDTSDINIVINTIAQQCAINVANQAFGDLVAQSQINYLKRITNSLLRYSKAMASTDERQVVAQPSLTQLFTSFKTIMSYLQNNSKIPIVEARNFTWTEQPLPIDAVSNIIPAPNTYIATSKNIIGFNVLTKLACFQTYTIDKTKCKNNQISYCVCSTSSLSLTSADMQLGSFLGPIPLSLAGIYTMYYLGNTSNPSTSTVQFVLAQKSFGLPAVTTPQASSLYKCVQFGPYKGLADFSSTDFMLNGIPTGYTALPASACAAYQLMSSGSVRSTIYAFYGIRESVIIPFYSNCTRDQLVSANLDSGLTELNYFSNFTGTLCTSNCVIPPNDIYTSTGLYQSHMVSSTCAINIEPEWLGLNYYLYRPPTTIPSIYTGFKLEQFTVNPLGELSSSLTFVYTSAWVWTYRVTRTSQNSLITDEVDTLDGDSVLFYLNTNQTVVIDESNSFYGSGNNGRDCITKADSYDYDLTSCIFQNNLVSYDTNEYFKGGVRTTGIARYVDKYDFNIKPVGTGYSLTLIPKDSADFRFYLQPDGTICPRLVARSSDFSGCQFTFSYSGTGTPSVDDNLLVFDSNGLSNITADIASIVNLKTAPNGQSCMVIYCKFYSNTRSSSIQFDPPSYNIISADDLALESKVYYSIDKTLNGTLTNVQNIIDQSESVNTVLQNLSKAVNSLDFNVTKSNEYQNFSALRKLVDDSINQITDKPANSGWDFFSTSECTGIFGGVACFFRDLASTIVVILIIAAVVVGSYLVCFKFGLYKKIFK